MECLLALARARRRVLWLSHHDQHVCSRNAGVQVDQSCVVWSNKLGMWADSFSADYWIVNVGWRSIKNDDL